MVVQRHRVARVEMWGQLVGALSYDERTDLCAFQYAPEWVQAGIEISPIKMPLPKQDPQRIYQFPTLARDTFKGLPGIFADSLPDAFGNALIDAWLVRAGRDKNSFSALERLLYTGKRGIGALEYSPSIIDKGLNAQQVLELDSLVEMAQSILEQRAQLAQISGVKENKAALAAILQVGTSAGGARPKAVIGINRARTEIRSGQVELPDDFEYFLLKFDGVVEYAQTKETFGDPQGFGRMEYAYYLMAKAAQIDMSYCELLMEGDRAHFMTRRFDRIGNKKIHYQSLCAMDHADYKTPGAYSYEQLFALMRVLRLNKAQALQMYRRMVFNIVARNHDDHTKNFGFLLNDNNAWEIAPAFDIAYSNKPGSQWVHAHQLSLNAKRDNFVRADLLSLAESFHKEAQQIIDEIIAVVSQWPQYARAAGVAAAFSKEIQVAHRLHL